jgi:2,6-dihydroxypyridine 3-monooxygenase
VQRINKIGNVYSIETSTKTYQSDFIIAADGVDSSIRNKLFPNASPKYAGYIAWRGVTEITSNCLANNLEAQIPYYMFAGGHILLYRIPSKDYQLTGHTLLNWVMYEDRPGKPLSEFLIDNVGRQHTRSLSPGSLSESHISYLHEFANHVLPYPLAEIVNQTKQPFVQAVFDFQLSDYSDKSIVFVGDSASTLRPHTGSGVLKALTSSIALFNIINNSDADDLLALLSKWQESQQEMAEEETSKAITMGRALVTHSPNWNQMNQDSTDEWWGKVMQGKTWYATEMAAEKMHEMRNQALNYTKI